MVPMVPMAATNGANGRYQWCQWPLPMAVLPALLATWQWFTRNEYLYIIVLSSFNKYIDAIIWTIFKQFSRIISTTSLEQIVERWLMKRWYIKSRHWDGENDAYVLSMSRKNLENSEDILSNFTSYKMLQHLNFHCPNFRLLTDIERV